MKIKTIKKDIEDIFKVLERFNKININVSNLSANQLKLFEGLDADQLQSYIDKIKEIQNTDFDIDSQPLYEYADTLNDLDSSQAALLLSTQGLSNAQIRQTILIKEGNTEKAHQALANAGLLVSKKNS